MEYKLLVDRHISCGYWDSENDSRHGYILCPQPFVLPRKWIEQLRDIGIGVHAFQKTIPKLFAEIQHGKTNFHANLRHLLPQATFGLPVINLPYSLPLVKVDVMVDMHDDLHIAEIDAYNLRGAAYAALLRDLHELPPSGVIPFLANEVRKRGMTKLCWIFAHHERWYEKGFKQFARIMEHAEGIQVSCMDASCKITEQALAECALLLIPWGMRQKEEIQTRTLLLELYNQNAERFIYPLCPWLGSKSWLGIISNAGEKKELEQLSSSFSELSLLKKYIPKTALAGQVFPESRSFINGDPYVLKENVSSGLKGVWFSNEDQSCKWRLENYMSQRKSVAVIQKYITQKNISIETFSGNRDCHIRLIAYIDHNGAVVDVFLTGCTTHAVHGGKESILLPCIGNL